METTQTKKAGLSNKLIYPLLLPKRRLALLEGLCGVWKNRKPDPILELKKMRQERERKLPKLS